MASLDIDLRSFGNTCFMEPPLMSISVENLVDFFFFKNLQLAFFFSCSLCIKQVLKYPYLRKHILLTNCT